MVTIKNKYVLLAAGFWLGGVAFLLVGAWFKNQQWDGAGTLLSIGVLSQALGFGFFFFALMQSVFRKK